MNGKAIVAIAVALGILALLVSVKSRSPAAAPSLQPQAERLTADEAVPASLAERFAASRPRLATPSDSTGAAAGPYTNLLVRLMRGEEAPRLSVAEAEAFAQQNQRRAESLLAAYQASNERSFLREAMEKFPDDPRVAFAAAALGGAYESEEEAAKARRGWLDTFQKSAPDNALADYLSARDHFKAGERDLALQEVIAGASKPMRDYSLDWIQNTEEAFRGAGYSDVDAKAVASTTLLLPQLAQIRDVGKSLVEMSKEYRAIGDEASAQAVLQTASQLGARLDSSGTYTLIQSLVGVAIQRNVLTSLDPSVLFGDSGQTVQAQLEQLDERRASIRSTAQNFDQLLPRMSDADLSSYFERSKLFGDEAALRWVKSRYAP